MGVIALIFSQNAKTSFLLLYFSRMDSNYLEMKDLEEDTVLVSKSSLYKLHQDQLYNNQTNEMNINQLVSALGGIDNILSHYLSPKNDIQLSQTQLDSINNVINKQRQVTSLSCTHIFSFNKTNTFLFRVFSSQVAHTLTKFIQHTTIGIVMMIITSILMLWMGIVAVFDIFLQTNPQWTSSFICLMICILLAMMYIFAYLLTANIKAIKLTMKSFLFWAKLLAALKFVVVWLSLYWWFGDFMIPQGVTRSMFIAVQSCCCVVLILIIIGSCMIDAIYMKRKMKIFWNILLCLVWTAWTLEQVFYPPVQDTSIIIIRNDISISMLSMKVDSMKFLAIFFWQQAVYLILYPHKCVNIRISPHYRWD